MNDIKVYKNLVYRKTDKESLTADVYMPKEGENRSPILLIHGGGFLSGSKEMYGEWGNYLAESGFVAIAVNYTLSTPKQPSWPYVLEDVFYAANWIVDHSNKWNVDPQKLGVIGDSAGAILGSHLALQSTSFSSFKVRASVCVYGNYNFNLSSGSSQKEIQQLLGKSKEESPDLYTIASPINHIDNALNSPTFDNSFLIIWGDKDKLPIVKGSEEFYNALKSKNIDIDLITIKGEGHFWFNKIPGLKGGGISDFPNSKVAPKIINFLRNKLWINTPGNFSASLIESFRKTIENYYE